MHSITFKPREYQNSIANTCKKDNCLIVLPTGLGKTKTAILTLINRLNTHPNSKILFLTVTKPLALQIQKEIQESTNIPKEKISLFTGEVKPSKRAELWNQSTIIISTPQCIENDIINKNIGIKNVSLLIFDEAHHTVKNYAYNWISKNYNQHAEYPRIIGLTASPGSDAKSIKEICQNLYITEIEIRSSSDKDVKPYIQEIKIDWQMVELPKEFKEIKKDLETCLKPRIDFLKAWGLVGKNQVMISKTQLIQLQASIHQKISQGQKDIKLWQGISKTAETLKIYHALELLETQGLSQLIKYLENLYEIASKTNVKAVKNLIKDTNLKTALVKAQKINQDNQIHEPKLIKLQEIIKEKFRKGYKAIIFAQYRDSAQKIESILNQIPNIKAKLFVGQMKKDGMGLSQKEQAKIIQEFSEGTYNILIATSVAEQGLDLPEVNLVVFHEPIPSAIRTIQRKGRTGRHSKGEIIMLITKGTRDEAYHWAALNKEKRMYKELSQMKNKIKLQPQKELTQFHSIPSKTRTKPLSQQNMSEAKQSDNIKIIADQRERNSQIIKHLITLKVEVKTEQLESADYILSKNVAVELKTKKDFVNSIVDGRLLSQLKCLRENFQIPLLILEGEEDIYSLRNVHPNAIRGMLSTIAITYNIPIIHTKNNKDTAELLKIIADREQNPKNKDFSIRPERKPLTSKEQQQYIIEGLPGIGPTLAKSLLKDFKTIKNIINAPQDQLQKTAKIGKKKAEQIQKILEYEYS